jgi:hypothetical protein
MNWRLMRFLGNGYSWLLVMAGKSPLNSVLCLVYFFIIQYESLRKVVTRPMSGNGLYNVAKNKFIELCRVAIHSRYGTGIIGISNEMCNEMCNERNNMTPRARQIYHDLKAAITQCQKDQG